MNPDIKEQLAACELFAIGGSAGSFTDMIEWVKNLRGIPVVLIIHRNKEHRSNLASLMQYFSKMKVKEAEEGEEIVKNTIYIAPAGYHLSMDDTKWRLLDTPPVWYCKPAIDVLFASMAKSLGNKAGAVLLSGANEDGALGLLDIKKANGATLCIRPDQAEYSMMPQAAIDRKAATYSFDRKEIPDLAASLGD